MNHIRISLIASAFIATLFFTGCYTQTVTTQSKAHYILMQYSGGKEIGRWYLNGFPDGGLSFHSGDTIVWLTGDTRLLSLP